jgi:organic radical activating enzyme
MSAMSEREERVYKPTYMELAITQFCPNRCAHCGFGYGPYGKTLSEAVLSRLLKDSREEGIDAIHISGGEPFATPNTYHAVREADNDDISVACITTSGFFGKTKESAKRILQKLKDARYEPEGYFVRRKGKKEWRQSRFRISTDEFHQKYVPLRSVGNVIDAYYEVFGPNNNLVISTRGTKTKTAERTILPMIERSLVARKLLAEKERYFSAGNFQLLLKHGMITIETGSICDFGNAESLDDGAFDRIKVKERLSLDAKYPLPCFGRLDLIHEDDIFVTGDGSVYPCCKFAAPKIPRLNAGNVNEDTIGDIIARINDDNIMNALMFNGPAALFYLVSDLMLEKDPNYCNKPVSIKCKVCKDILTDERMLEALESKLEDSGTFKRKMRSLAASIEQIV